MKYIVVKDTDLERMVAWVNELIKEGWEPFGGVSSAGGNGFGEKIYFLQAMVNPVDPTNSMKRKKYSVGGKR